MKKIKILFYKIYTRLIWYLIVLIFIVIISNCILGTIGLRLRSCVFITTFLILVVGILIKGIQKFIKQPTNVKKTIGKILGILIIMSIAFFRITALILFLVLVCVSSFIPSAEHVVTRNGVKCVAVVNTGFLNTDVDYYRYVNFLVMGNKPLDTEYYNGSYDPIKSQVERKEERAKENTKTNNVVTDNSQNIIKQESIKKEEIIEYL